jgi:hypothetical protein
MICRFARYVAVYYDQPEIPVQVKEYDMTATSSTPDKEAVYRNVVGVFIEGSSIEEAIAQLKQCGFEKKDLGLMAQGTAITDKLHDLYEEVAWDPDSDEQPEYRFIEKQSVKSSASAFLGGLGVVASAAVSGAVVASAAVIAGPVGAATAGAAAVGGVGALASTIISESDAQRLQAFLEEGHLLLFIHSKDNDQEEQAKAIMSGMSGVETDVVEFRTAA